MLNLTREDKKLLGVMHISTDELNHTHIAAKVRAHYAVPKQIAEEPKVPLAAFEEANEIAEIYRGIAAEATRERNQLQADLDAVTANFIGLCKKFDERAEGEQEQRENKCFWRAFALCMIVLYVWTLYKFSGL